MAEGSVETSERAELRECRTRAMCWLGNVTAFRTIVDEESVTLHPGLHAESYEWFARYPGGRTHSADLGTRAPTSARRVLGDRLLLARHPRRDRGQQPWMRRSSPLPFRTRAQTDADLA